jgi:hypothetical protein
MASKAGGQGQEMRPLKHADILVAVTNRANIHNMAGGKQNQSLYLMICLWSLKMKVMWGEGYYNYLQILA